MGKDWGSMLSVAFLIVVSAVGLALIPVLILQPSLMHSQVSLQHVLIGTLYITICALGIIAAVYPAKCKNMFRRPQNPLSQENNSSIPMQITGHHPDCQNYSANRIKVGGRAICAACSGLLIGAICAFIGAVLYFFVGFNVAWSSLWLLALGEVCMFLGLAQIKFAGYVKVTFNVLFVVGSLLTLVETDLLGESLLVNLYAVGLIVFMLWLRIQLSEWNNGRICRKCQLCFQ
jgi:cbb3-type cytochrome oxidase subunit 3